MINRFPVNTTSEDLSIEEKSILKLLERDMTASELEAHIAPILGMKVLVLRPVGSGYAAAGINRNGKYIDSISISEDEFKAPAFARWLYQASIFNF
ncbi:MAG: hypothetical protein ACRC2Y_04355 [Aeromonas veronii]